MSKLDFKENIPFTQVANEVLYDRTLSAKSKGMFAYLFSKPVGWQFSSWRIVEEMKEGRTSILGMLRELEKHGYLQRIRHSDGRMDYGIKFSSEPELGNATVQKVHCAETHPVSNTDTISNTDKNNNTKVVTTIKWSVTDGWDISTEEMERLMKVYPQHNIPQQLNNMGEWLRTYPKRSHKKNWRRFVTGWLNRQK